MYMAGIGRIRGLGDDSPYYVDQQNPDAYAYPVPNGIIIPDSSTLPMPPPPPALPSLPSASSTGPTNNVDWTSIAKAAMQTWGQVSNSQAQVDIAKARYANPYANYGMVNPQTGLPYSPLSPLPGSSGYLPFPGMASSGTIFGIPTTYVLLGAAAVAAFFIAKG